MEYKEINSLWRSIMEYRFKNYDDSMFRLRLEWKYKPIIGKVLKLKGDAFNERVEKYDENSFTFLFKAIEFIKLFGSEDNIRDKMVLRDGIIIYILAVKEYNDDNDNNNEDYYDYEKEESEKIVFKIAVRNSYEAVFVM